MNVRELIEWLTKFNDQDAVVKVVAHQRGSGYYDQGGIAVEAEFNPELHTEYYDGRFGRSKPTLLLGEIDG